MQPEQQQRIMGYFIEEAKDHLNTIERGLLNLQSTIEDAEMVNEVFRAAHSVKGGAAMLGLNAIQHTSHRLEDYFKILKETVGIRVDQKLESLLLRVFDTLQELLEQLQGPFGLTEEASSAAMAGIEPVFAELEQHLGALSGDAVMPDSVPTVVGIARPLFNEYVSADLRELLDLFKQAEGLTDGRSQLVALADRLRGHGVQEGLNEWVTLVDQVKAAIANPDNAYRVLASVVIKELKQAQDWVKLDSPGQIAASEQLLALLPLAVDADAIDLDVAALDVAAGDLTDADLDFDLLGNDDLLGGLDAGDLGGLDSELDFDGLGDGLGDDLAFDLAGDAGSLDGDLDGLLNDLDRSAAGTDAAGADLDLGDASFAAALGDDSDLLADLDFATSDQDGLGDLDLDFGEGLGNGLSGDLGDGLSDSLGDDDDLGLDLFDQVGGDSGLDLSEPAADDFRIALDEESTASLENLGELFMGVDERELTLVQDFSTSSIDLTGADLDLGDRPDLITQALDLDNLALDDEGDSTFLNTDAEDEALSDTDLGLNVLALEDATPALSDLDLATDAPIDWSGASLDELDLDLAAADDAMSVSDLGDLDLDGLDLGESESDLSASSVDDLNLGDALDLGDDLGSDDQSGLGELGLGELDLGELDLGDLDLDDREPSLVFDELESNALALDDADLAAIEDLGLDAPVEADTTGLNADLGLDDLDLGDSDLGDFDLGDLASDGADGLTALQLGDDAAIVDFGNDGADGLTELQLADNAAIGDLDSLDLDLGSDLGLDDVSLDDVDYLDDAGLAAFATTAPISDADLGSLDDLDLDAVDDLALDGLESDGLASDGLELDSLELDGLELDGSELDGLALDDADLATADNQLDPMQLDVDDLGDVDALLGQDDLDFGDEPTADLVIDSAIVDGARATGEVEDLSGDWADASSWDAGDAADDLAIGGELPVVPELEAEPLGTERETGDLSDLSFADADLAAADLAIDDLDAGLDVGAEVPGLDALDLDDLGGFDNLDESDSGFDLGDLGLAAAGAGAIGAGAMGFAAMNNAADDSADLDRDIGELDANDLAADDLDSADLDALIGLDDGDELADLSDLDLGGDLGLGGDVDFDADLAAVDFDNSAAFGDDLDALLDDGDLGVAAGSDFGQLDALLDAPMAPTIDADLAALAADPEFDDLERLLLDDKDAAPGGAGLSAKAGLAAKAAAARRPARPGKGFSEQTMRVSVKHLDSLSNLVGELVVNRNSLEQDQERMRQSLDNLLYQVQQLSDVGQRMQDLYERSLLESSLMASRQQRSDLPFPIVKPAELANNREDDVEYDPLEMDRFTGFHTLSQEMIELIVRVRESASDIEFIVDETDQVTRMFRQVTTQLQEGLTRSRMVPFAQTADRLPRAVRDIAMKVGKQAELVVEGRDTLIDKMILEHLYDPMTHLVNNAITHGIEVPEARRSASKGDVGRITIRAFHQGNQTVISVSDDGAGIDVERVRMKGIEKGLITSAEAQTMSRLDLFDLIFHPGFSTRDQADDFAGRGVGMDVVRTSLTEIRGAVTIDSNPGKGTTFTIRLPLTLSISKALCCISDRARIAFPMDGVEDMLDLPKDRLQRDADGQMTVPWRDTVLPLRPLTELLAHNRHLSRGNVYGGNQEDDIISVVVLRSAGSYLALQVDQVLGEQEIVIKQLEGPVPKPVGIAGATVLGDGRIMPIADVLELIDLAMGRLRRDSGSMWEQDGGAAAIEVAAEKTDPLVLIVDDSITVRELLSMTFNKVGYRVEQARDGQEAWEKLRAGLPCDIVFCDIEMPRMDGLELLSRIQKDPQLKQLPVAMLTSRGADRHRQMATSLGARGYFTKPYLEEALLDAAARMLQGEIMMGR